MAVQIENQEDFVMASELLRPILDRYSAERFVDEGRQAASMTLYPPRARTAFVSGRTGRHGWILKNMIWRWAKHAGSLRSAASEV